MHPEIREPRPGKCPKCGMQLVLESTLHNMPPDRGLGVLTWRNYLPLVSIIASIFTLTIIFSVKDFRAGIFSWTTALSMFMAFFFTVFSAFKLLDLKGFAEGYAMYDLLAMRLSIYGYLYPFIELFFGLSMLATLFWGVSLVNMSTLLWLELVVMAFSGTGVLIKLLKGEEVKCVCLGTVLKVPLTNITLVEDFGMAILALFLILK